MRRHDREITDKEKIREIILSCDCCRLGLCDDGEAYIVPLNFGFQDEAGQWIFYFHSACQGRKIDLIRKCGRACFELDTNYKLNTADTACGFSSRFQSVIGTGSVEILEHPEGKRSALLAIMEKSTGHRSWEFSPQMLNNVCAFKLTVEELSCKEHM